MKIHTRLAAITLLTIGTNTSHAQLDGPLGAADITATIERVNEESIERKLEDALTETIERRFEESIANRLEQIDNATLSTITSLPTDLQNIQSLPQIISSLNTLPAFVSITDKNGNTVFNEVELSPGVRTVEHEWIVWIDENKHITIDATKINLLEDKKLPALDMRYLRFKVNKNNDYLDYVTSLFPPNTALNIQRNHIFETSTSLNSISSTEVDIATTNEIKKNFCEAPLPIGIIDTAIQQQHPVFKNSKIQQQSFVDHQLIEPTTHATSVASLIVGKELMTDKKTVFYGAVPDAELFVASVFYQRDNYSQGATSESLINALNWLLEKNVAVINMSLAGPEDRLLAFALDKVQQQGGRIIAAAGNAGPASTPLYPAAYASVIAVTAIDDKDVIYRWAVQGEHIDIAALGVKVKVARANGGYAYESGTSLATPLVSSFIACALTAPENKNISTIELLQRNSQDLGNKGRDRIFGFGRLIF